MTRLDTATLDLYAARRVRTGKTKRDKASGAWARRRDNMQERAAWSNDRTKSQFPTHTCKGLGNSSKRYKAQAGRAA